MFYIVPALLRPAERNKAFQIMCQQNSQAQRLRHTTELLTTPLSLQITSLVGKVLMNPIRGSDGMKTNDNLPRTGGDKHSHLS